MSLASNQTLLLLSMVNGSLKIMDVNGMHSPQTENTGMYASDLVESIIHRYPATGDERKNLKWMHDKLKRWSVMINEIDKEWPVLVLATMSLNIMEDLVGLIKNKAVLDDLCTLRDAFISMSEYMIGQVGDEFVHFSEADDLLNRMYSLIEFSR